MTLNNLYKRLGKLIEQGHGRRRVSIHKETFHDNRENDGCVILPICEVYTQWIPDVDDDGFLATNKDGSERGRVTVIFGGSSAETVPASEVAK